MKLHALRTFPLSRDGLRSETVEKGTDFDCPLQLADGLIAEGFAADPKADAAKKADAEVKAREAAEAAEAKAAAERKARANEEAREAEEAARKADAAAAARATKDAGGPAENKQAPPAKKA